MLWELLNSYNQNIHQLEREIDSWTMNFRRVWWRSVASMNAYTALLLTTETEILNTPYRLQNNISMSYLHRWWYWRHASYWKEGSKKTTIAAATYRRRCGCVKDAAWGNGEHGWSILEKNDCVVTGSTHISHSLHWRQLRHLNSSHILHSLKKSIVTFLLQDFLPFHINRPINTTI